MLRCLSLFLSELRACAVSLCFSFLPEHLLDPLDFACSLTALAFRETMWIDETVSTSAGQTGRENTRIEESQTIVYRLIDLTLRPDHSLSFECDLRVKIDSTSAFFPRFRVCFSIQQRVNGSFPSFVFFLPFFPR